MIDIETRVRKLERQNRWLAGGFLASIGAVVAMGAAQKGDEKVIRADRVVTKFLSVVGPDGEAKISLLIDKDAPSILLRGKEERPRIVMGVSGDGTAVFQLNNGKDRSSEIRLASGGSDDDGDGRKVSLSRICLYDESTEERLRLTADSKSNTLIQGKSRNGETRTFATFDTPQAKAKP